MVAVKALGWAAFITVVLAAAMFAVPGVVAWLSSSHSGALRTVLDDLGFGSGTGWTPAAIGGFVAAVIAVSQSARNTLTKYNLLKTPEAAQGDRAANRGSTSTIPPRAPAALAGQRLGPARVRRGRAALGERRRSGRIHRGPGCGRSSARSAVMLVMRFLADANRISLHDFYRWRLTSAYSVIRETAWPGWRASAVRYKRLSRRPAVAAERAAARTGSVHHRQHQRPPGGTLRARRA